MMENCPKCHRPALEGETACARCGLLRARWETYDGRPQAHAVLDPLWEDAVADWDNAKRHEALAAAVARDWQGLSNLAQRYSAVLRDRPQDAVAGAARDRLIHVAMKTPLPRAADTSAKSAAGQAVKMLLAVAMTVLAAYLMSKLIQMPRPVPARQAGPPTKVMKPVAPSPSMQPAP